MYWHKFAEINLNLNLFEEASKAYYKCIGLQDDRLEVYIALVDVLHFLGEFHEAIQVLLDAREKYENTAEITYRLAGLNFLIQKDKEGFFFLEKSLKNDFEYQSVIKKMFPIVFARKEVNYLVQKYKSLL